ncbi:MAG: zf-HC2 domain-containing protein [Armatimonadota bacterium]
MKCPDIEQLAAYQTDAVNATERRRIDEHVAACATCRHELAALEEVAGMVSALPQPAMPDNLWPGVAARLEPRRTPVSAWWRALAGAGMLAVLLFGSVQAYHASQPLPMASETASAFVTRHEFLTAQDPLVDRASVGVMMISQEERP